MRGAARIAAASSLSPTDWCALFANPLGSVRRLRNLGTAGLRSAASREIRVVAPQHRRRRPCSQARPRRGTAMKRAGPAEFDVIIVGAGVTASGAGKPAAGAQVEHAGQGGAGRRSLRAPPPASGADWDLRVFALSRASERLLQALRRMEFAAREPGVPPMSACAFGMRAARRTAPDSLTFDCAEIGEPNLGLHRRRQAPAMALPASRLAPRASSASRVGRVDLGRRR